MATLPESTDRDLENNKDPKSKKRQREDDEDDDDNVFEHQTKKLKTTTCPICLEELTDNEMTTSCGHMFHQKCIDEWENHSTTCPVCRTHIFEPRQQESPLTFEEFLESAININNNSVTVHFLVRGTPYILSFTL